MITCRNQCTGMKACTCDTSSVPFGYCNCVCMSSSLHLALNWRLTLWEQFQRRVRFQSPKKYPSSMRSAILKRTVLLPRKICLYEDCHELLVCTYRDILCIDSLGPHTWKHRVTKCSDASFYRVSFVSTGWRRRPGWPTHDVRRLYHPKTPDRTTRIAGV